ncbi:hypothetical protein [Singulisphaera sp. PoT]|uniref:hypothetical protein n=1 Tax=Singulisphaera sp. PoT TaxID=3411797 RepID=UPI003BF569E9
MANPLVIASAILEVGTNGIPNAQQQLGDLKQNLDDLRKAQDAGTISMGDYLRGAAALSGQIGEMERGVQLAEKAVRKYGSATEAATVMGKKAKESTDGLKSGFGSFAMTAMSVSQAVDDIQYGFKGVINNIPQIASGFASIAGLSPGVGMLVGAVAQVGGVILEKALPALEDMAVKYGLIEDASQKAIDEAVGDLDTLEARIKAVNDKPIKLAVDKLELEAAQKQLKGFKDGLNSFESTSNLRSSHQQEAGREAKKALSETGRADEIMRKLRAEEFKKLEAQVKESKQNEIDEVSREYDKHYEQFIKDPDGNVLLNEKLNQLAERKKELEDARPEALRQASLANEKQAESFIGDLAKRTFEGNDATAREQLAAKLDAIGEKAPAKTIRETTPETVKTNAEQKEADRTGAAAFRDRIQDQLADHDAMAPWAEKLVAARKAGGMQVDGKFQDMNLAQIQERFKTLISNVWEEGLSEQDKKNKKLHEEMRGLANNYVKALDSMAKGLEQTANRKAKEDVQSPLEGFIRGNRLEEKATADMKAKIAKGMAPEQAYNETAAGLEDTLNEFTKKRGKDSAAVRDQNRERARAIANRADGNLTEESAGAKRKDTKYGEELFGISADTLGTDQQIGMMIAQLNTRAEQMQAHGMKAPDEEQIKQHILATIKQWLHRRTGENGRVIKDRSGKVFDPNPRMDEQATNETAEALYERANKNLDKQYYGITNHMLNNSQRLIQINNSMASQWNTMLQEAFNQSSQIGNLDARVRRQSLSTKSRGTRTGRSG